MRKIEFAAKAYSGGGGWTKSWGGGGSSSKNFKKEGKNEKKGKNFGQNHSEYAHDCNILFLKKYATYKQFVE